MVAVRPREIDDLLANPLMGWETFHRTADSDPALAGLPSSTAYYRFYWRQLEPEKDRYAFDMLDGLLARARAAGQKLAFRIMICGTHRDYSYSPDYLMQGGYRGFEYSRGGRTYWAPDLDDPRVLERHLKLIRAIGRRYDGHPDVAVVDIGSVTTPMVTFAVARYGYDAGLMVTASHNPAKYNGIKLTAKGAEPVSYDTGINQIEEMVASGNLPEAPTKGSVTSRDILADYIEHLLTAARDIHGLKVVIDAGNGMAGMLMPPLFEKLDCELVPLSVSYTHLTLPTN